MPEPHPCAVPSSKSYRTPPDAGYVVGPELGDCDGDGLGDGDGPADGLGDGLGEGDGLALGDGDAPLRAACQAWPCGVRLDPLSRAKSPWLAAVYCWAPIRPDGISELSSFKAAVVQGPTMFGSL